MKTKRERLLHIHCGLADHWRAMSRLLQWDPDLTRIYTLSSQESSALLSLSSHHAVKFHSFLHSVSLSSIVQYMNANHIFYVTILDEEYPALLREIPDPPFVLYGVGNRDILTYNQALAVVGTRTPTLYGIQAVRSLLQELLEESWVIVSGMAKGIDMEAHLIAAAKKKYTIAVLGGGFCYMYPQEHYAVLQQHFPYYLLLTEYPPHFKPKKWYFPRRNRIISGLASGTVVIEAKERSGSLITADCALEQNREVFAVPGPIHSDQSAGANKLIQQGAKLVMKSADIVEELRKY